ncbi:hypothetical protein C7999DRAFT_42690 [Corynascus novoguineensis]|uniref:Uncharacterized protein n=1 Tax=Corynascus novoguineensis TaxID=1126955 RepID=A0AAN7HLF7_9PEZI|nr:hypothetical protein C7999DRAFT_42690 [Corynascus novoguineensis]
MEQIENANDWSSGDASGSDNSSSSASDGEEFQLAPRSQLRPAGAALRFVPHADWNPERSYEGERTIHWNMQWKLCLKRREQTGESELGIVISPRRFWKHAMEDDTKVVLSVTDRKMANITKRYPKLEVEWKYVSKQIQEWSKFLADGKKITVMVTFYYQSVDAGKAGRGGATANQQAELDQNCWMLADHMQAGKPLNGHDDDAEREREEREHKERAKTRKRRRRDSDGSVAGGTCIMANQCHRCVAGSGVAPNLPTSPSIVFPTSPSIVFPTSPLIQLDLPREVAVREYSAWHQDQVCTDEQKQHYDAARELTLKQCYDLNILTINPKKMYSFYIRNGIPDGVAWRFVGDVKAFLVDRERAQGI